MWCSKVNKIVENNFINGQRYVELPSSDSLFYIRGGRSGKFRVDTANKTFLYKSEKLIQLNAMTVDPILVSELDSQNVLPPIAWQLPERPK